MPGLGGSRLTGVTKYPVPGPMGGRLIRAVISSLRRDCGLVLPIDSDILIAVSGGSDSVALAHLLIRYGRRVVSPDRISILHLNHGWRGEESDGDELWVKKLGASWGISVKGVRLLDPKTRPARVSPEEYARALRKSEYARHRAQGGWVLTAHHADDLAETLIWRFLTGGFPNQARGILPVTQDGELRPLLRVSKEDLRAFLREEGVLWREDRSNAEGHLLRSQMRHELMPVIERLFPGYRRHLIRLAKKT